MSRTKCHEPLSGIIVIMNDTKAAQAASIRARLLNLSRDKKIDFNRILTIYGLERLLYRLSVSEYRDEFVLKGAMLFSYWSGDAYRATRDVDFLKSGDASITYLSQVFKRLCEQDRDVDYGDDLLNALNRLTIPTATKSTTAVPFLVSMSCVGTSQTFMATTALHP